MLYVLLVLTIGLASRFFSAEQYEASSASAEFYVSSTGSDSNSGTIDAPFKTIEKAKLSARSTAGNVNINLRGGVYELSNPINLTSADSGKGGGVVTYQSYQNEVVVVRGSKALAGFTAIGGGIYEVDLTANGLGTQTVKDLFVNGVRQIPARYPNYIAPNFSKTDPWEGNFVFAASNTPEVKNKVVYSDTFTRPESWSNPTTGSVNIYSGPNYWNSIVPISALNKAGRTINFGSDVTYNLLPGNRFFVENIREELDAPGEWFFDASAKKVLLIPPAGININSDRISVPISNYIFNPNGANNIKFSHLVLEESQRHALYLISSKDITIDNSVIRNTTERGIFVQGSSERVSINNNIIHDTGDDGIMIDQTDYSYRKNLSSSGHSITNNRVYLVGQIIKWGSGIKASSTVGLKIANNEVYDTPRVGIFLVGNDTVVESNHVHNTNRETQDSGGIYTIARSWLYRGNVINNNFVHDTGGYGRSGSVWIFNYFSWGIYLDDFSSGTWVYNNVVARSPKGGVQVHGGRDNTVTNNIFSESLTESNTYLQGRDVSVSLYSTMWNELSAMSANGFDHDKYFAKYPELSTITETMTNATAYAGNKITKNIFYFPSHPSVRLYWVRYFIGNTGNVVDYNVIWNGGVALSVTHPESAGSQLSWDQWKAFGYDTHSVIADPLFKDPGHDNYELKSGSPALQVGFVPFITSDVGPTTPPPIDPGSADRYNNTSTNNDAASTSSTPNAGTSGSTNSKSKKNNSADTSPGTQVSKTEQAINLPDITEGEDISLKDQFKILGIKQGSVVVVSVLVILLMLCSLAVMFVHKLKIEHLRRLQRSFRNLHS